VISPVGFGPTRNASLPLRTLYLLTQELSPRVRTGYQPFVLRRKVRGRARLTNNDPWFFIQVSMVSVDPAGPHDHPSRDARALASGGLSLLLALEVALTGRVAADRDGPPRVDPADEHREPVLSENSIRLDSHRKAESHY
jgi:hypothetical protein